MKIHGLWYDLFFRSRVWGVGEAIADEVSGDVETFLIFKNHEILKRTFNTSEFSNLKMIPSDSRLWSTEGDASRDGFAESAFMRFQITFQGNPELRVWSTKFLIS